MLRLIAVTSDIIECNVHGALSEGGPRGRLAGVTEPHTPADNVSVVQVPVVIAHGSPGSLIEYL